MPAGLKISNRDRILAAVRTRGLTLRALDAECQLPRGACSAAIHKPYHEAEKRISHFLGVPAHQLWPERYNSNGTRKQPQPATNYRPRPRFARAGATA